MPASFATDRTEEGSSSTTHMRSDGTSTVVTLLMVEHASSTESLPKASTSANLSAPLRASGSVYGNETFLLGCCHPKNILRKGGAFRRMTGVRESSIIRSPRLYVQEKSQ